MGTFSSCQPLCSSHARKGSLSRKSGPRQFTPSAVLFLHEWAGSGAVVETHVSPKNTQNLQISVKPAVVRFDRLQLSTVRTQEQEHKNKNTSSMSCWEIFWLAFGMWNDLSPNLVCSSCFVKLRLLRWHSIFVSQGLFASCLLMDLEG